MSKLVASFLEKSESKIRIRLSDVGSCLNKFPLSGVSLKKHFTGTLPRVEEKATDLAYFDYVPISKEERRRQQIQ